MRKENKKSVELGRENYAKVRTLMETKLGISRVEVARELGLSAMAVTRHVAEVRRGWGADTLPTKRRKV